MHNNYTFKPGRPIEMFLCFAFLFQYTWDLEQKIPVMDIALYCTVQLLGCKKRAGRQQ